MGEVKVSVKSGRAEIIVQSLSIDPIDTTRELLTSPVSSCTVLCPSCGIEAHTLAVAMAIFP
jgi:hypothetical protein